MATFEPIEGVAGFEPDNGETAWLRSSRCENANCLEVSFGRDVMVRNSASPDGPYLTITSSAWRNFVEAIKSDVLAR